MLRWKFWHSVTATDTVYNNQLTLFCFLQWFDGFSAFIFAKQGFPFETVCLKTQCCVSKVIPVSHCELLMYTWNLLLNWIVITISKFQKELLPLNIGRLIIKNNKNIKSVSNWYIFELDELPYLIQWIISW